MTEVFLQHMRLGGALPEDQSEELFRELVATDSAAFGVDMGPFWEKRPHVFGELSGLMVGRDASKLVGFLAYQLWQAKEGLVLYLDATVVLEEYRRHRFAREMVARVLMAVYRDNGFEPFFVACRTPNPVVVDALRKVIGERWFFPQIPLGDAPVPEDLSNIAEYVTGRLNPGLALRKPELVIPGALGSLGREVAKALGGGNEDVREFFDAHVDLNNGDCVVCVFRWDASTLSRAVFPDRGTAQVVAASGSTAVLEWESNATGENSGGNRRTSNSTGVTIVDVDADGDVSAWTDYSFLSKLV